MTYNQEQPIEVHYHDGKPEVKKVDLAKELSKELHQKEKPVNDMDTEKSALYANLPKAKDKMDKSLNARAINTMLESYNRQRNEARFDVQRNGHIITMKTAGYEFKCNDEFGTIETTKVPANGLKMSLKASRLKGADIDNFFDEVEKHLERHKVYSMQKSEARSIDKDSVIFKDGKYRHKVYGYEIELRDGKFHRANTQDNANTRVLNQKVQDITNSKSIDTAYDNADDKELAKLAQLKAKLNSLKDAYDKETNVLAKSRIRVAIKQMQDAIATQEDIVSASSNMNKDNLRTKQISKLLDTKK